MYIVGPRPLDGRSLLLGWGRGWGGAGWDNNVTDSLTHTSCYATVQKGSWKNLKL